MGIQWQNIEQTPQNCAHEKCSSLSHTREVKINITLRHYNIFIRMTESKNLL